MTTNHPNTSLHVFESPEEMSRAAAAWIASLISQVLKIKKRFSIVLSGGNTPKALYHLLASPPWNEKIAWDLVDFFWGDERFVPFDDDRNNAKMAFDALINHVPVKDAQIYRMRTDMSPQDSAIQYEEALKNYFEKSGDPGFDLVLLGMGDDGHTLSLFPGTAVVHEEKKLVVSFYLPAQNMYRITLTKTPVNESAQIAFLTTGAGKSRVLKEVLEGDENVDLYPSQSIRPAHGELHWFLDKDAAAGL